MLEGSIFHWLKNVHMLCAALTFTLFVLRGVWMLNNSALFHQRWTKKVPAIIDSTLLLTGIYMVVRTEQYPFSSSWITAKLFAVLLYIGFGIVGFRARTKHIRLMAWCTALIIFAYIFLAARTHSPIPFEIFIG